MEVQIFWQMLNEEDLAQYQLLRKRCRDFTVSKMRRE